jgi:hypothetical protein
MAGVCSDCETEICMDFKTKGELDLQIASDALRGRMQAIGARTKWHREWDRRFGFLPTNISDTS